jgi:hypothetical protein
MSILFASDLFGKTYLNGQEEMKNELFKINWQFVSNSDVSGYNPNVEDHDYEEAYCWSVSIDETCCWWGKKLKKMIKAFLI